MGSIAQESDSTCIVYPSWGTFSYRWSDIDSVVHKPAKSRWLPDTFDAIRLSQLGYAGEVPPCELFDGPFDGGIIVAPVRAPRLWLPALILSTEADILSPSPVLSKLEDLPFDVRSLVPRNERCGQSSKVAYACPLDYVEVRGDEAGVGLAIWTRGARKEARKEIDEACDVVNHVAEHFGLISVHCKGSAYQTIQLEASIPRQWKEAPLVFKLLNTRDQLGMVFSISLYTCLHLRSILGDKLLYMVLYRENPS